MKDIITLICVTIIVTCGVIFSAVGIIMYLGGLPKFNPMSDVWSLALGVIFIGAGLSLHSTEQGKFQ